MMNSSSKVVKIRNEAAEAVYSATYIEDYIDAIENLPDEIQRLLSRLKELDVETQNYVRDLKNYMDSAQGKEKDPGIIQRIQCLLIQVQDIGDEKIQIGQQVQDFVENRYRQLELDKKTLDAATRQPEREVLEPVVTPSAPVEPSDPYCRTYEPQHSRMKRARRARMDPSISGSKDEFPEVFQPSSSVSQTKPSSSTTTVSQKRKEKDKDKDKDNHDKDHDTPIVTPTTSTRRRNVSESADHVAATNVHETSSTRTPKKRKENDSQDDKPAATLAPATVTKRQYTYKSDKRKSENKDKDKEKEKEPTEKKKRKSRQVDDSPPLNLPIDPDEPTYCLCDQVSYGDMIGCDNDLCPIEWFHFNCVSLTLKPKGKWYCPKCRGDRPNVMKNKAIFLKELEEYNREKEEKA